jgi:DNA-binding MarR family transcriptional regulator
MQPTTNLGYLIHHISFVLDRQSDQVLQERLGIGFSQFKILMVLKWHTGILQKRIADHLGQTEASISRQIKLMTEMGLLQSRVTPTNRREHAATLTTKGDRVAEEATRLLNEYHTPMFARLSVKQQEVLTEILQIMHQETCRGDKPGSCQHAQK